MKVLLVDDERLALMQLEKMLKELGNIEVVGAFLNPAEALAMAGNLQPDVVFMDIQMPQMDGYKTIAAIRNEKKIDTPVVAMTAFAMPGERKKCITKDMDDYLSKPLEYNQLIGILEKFIYLEKEKKKAIKKEMPTESQKATVKIKRNNKE